MNEKILSKIDFEKYYYIGVRKSFNDYDFGIISYNNTFDSAIFIISQKRYFDGESWINSIIEGIKNVSVTYEEFQERKKRDDKIRENNFDGWDWDYDNNPLYYHIVDCSERYGQEKLATIYYLWASEVNFAYSYKDITEVTDMQGRISEYYSTSEVLEVLEKWKEALEKWNNPEERQKMIEEYERNNGGKT